MVSDRSRQHNAGARGREEGEGGGEVKRGQAMPGL